MKLQQTCKKGMQVLQLIPVPTGTVFAGYAAYLKAI